MQNVHASKRRAIQVENAVLHIKAVAKAIASHGRQKVAGIIRAVPIPAVEHDILYANFVGACEIRVTASDIV